MAAHSQAAAEKRFAALLQPIRDLAQNWAIDVARDLEDYLEELEGITVSFDGGVTSHMFVEAASLIQGSAAIYSRKVEYLYALIYQTLDLITQQRKKKGAAAKVKPRDVQDADADELLRVEAEEEFLLLEAVQPGRNIDLREKREDVQLQSALAYGLAAHGAGNAAAAHAAAQAAHGSLQHMLNLTAMSYGGGALGASGAERRDSLGSQSQSQSFHVGDATGLPGLNLNVSIGRVLLQSPAAHAAQQTLLARTPLARMTAAGLNGFGGGLGGGGVGGFGAQGAGIGGSFRLANAGVSRGGALVLNTGRAAATASALSLELLQGTGATAATAAGPDGSVVVAPAEQGAENALEQQQQQPEQERGDGGLGSAADDDGDYGGGGGYDENGWFHNHDDSLAGGTGVGAGAGAGAGAGPGAGAGADAAAAAGSGVARGPREARSRRVIAPGRATATAPALDPWAQLDPEADLGAAAHKPFKQARTWIALPDAALVAAKGPEAAAAAIAAQRARRAQAGASASGGGSMAVARQLAAQARILSARAAAARAAGPLLVASARSGASVASSTAAAAAAFALYASSSSLIGAADAPVDAHQRAAREAEAASGGGLFVPLSRALASLALDAPAASSGAAAGSEIVALVQRQRNAGLRARRSHRRRVAAAFPAAAAAGEAYDESAFLGGADADDDGSGAYGGGGGYDEHLAPLEQGAGDAPNYGAMEDDKGLLLADALGAGPSAAAAPRPPFDPRRLVASLEAELEVDTAGVPDDAMAYLNDVARGDAEFERAHANARSGAGAGAGAGAGGVFMGSLAGEDDDFHSSVRAQIAAFTANANAFLASSRMQRRIDGWQAKMEPLLAQEEARPEFSMRAYGDKVLTAISSLQGSDGAESDAGAGPTSFASVVAALRPEPYEVCRLFLAALQLANNGNIDIDGFGGETESAAEVKGAAKGAAASADSESEAWMFSQAVKYSDHDGAVEAQVAAASRLEQQRLERQQPAKAGGRRAGGSAAVGVNAFPGDGHIRVARLGFAMTLLTNRPRYDLDSYRAPSEEQRRAGGDVEGDEEDGAPSANIAAADDDDDGDDDGPVASNGAVRRREQAQARLRAVLSPSKAALAPAPAAAAAAAGAVSARPPRPASAAAPDAAPEAFAKRGRAAARSQVGAGSNKGASKAKRSTSRAGPEGTDENLGVGGSAAHEVDDDEDAEEGAGVAVLSAARARSGSSRGSRGKAAAAAPAAAKAAPASVFGDAEIRSPAGKRANAGGPTGTSGRV